MTKKIYLTGTEFLLPSLIAFSLGHCYLIVPPRLIDALSV